MLSSGIHAPEYRGRPGEHRETRSRIHRVLGGGVVGVHAVALPNSVAAILLPGQARANKCPHVYVEWADGDPVANLLRFLFLGAGAGAPVTREIPHRGVPRWSQRPHAHPDSSQSRRI
ncbi:hypothetical protein HLB23_39955 [Nocardia uniformis]|uniref:Uncharacterized protein n=1 Tax=Nocardia uniformis TaxID=53432 RepID=A0A849CBP1_9NOCA|nr:hypothetical protein [Nocardia uniformis]NNH75962.1 hypothetical protein [Nocardia uniformis]